jgi:hypothetical protein
VCTFNFVKEEARATASHSFGIGCSANMPSALHPQAKFDPIPPDLDLSVLVEKTPNFDYVIRIAADQIHELGLEQFEKLVLLHVVVGGKPLVVEGWNKSLPPWLFSWTWLEDNVGKKRKCITAGHAVLFY